MELSLKQINGILADVFSDYNAPKLTKIKTDQTHRGNRYDGDNEMSQGEYDEDTTYYSHADLPESIFVAVCVQSDSYGDNEHVSSVQLVEGKPRTITVFEPI